MYGRNPSTGVNTKTPVKNETAIAFKKRIDDIRAEANAALLYASLRMKQNYDKKKSKAYQYEIGDKVWLVGTNINPIRPTAKLSDKRYGPFKITNKFGNSAFQLDLPKTWKIHPVFNEILLTPFIEAEFPSQKKPSPPPPISVEGQEEFEVEEVLKSRKNRGKLEYLVKWKGYGNEENSWEPKKNLSNTKEILADFYIKHPDALRVMEWTELPDYIRSVQMSNLNTIQSKLAAICKTAML